MRNDINNLLENFAPQGSDEWRMERMGSFTGSTIHRLMKKGRGKDAEWSQDAITYIKSVAAWRLKNAEYFKDPIGMGEYMWLYNTTSKAMDYGKSKEPYAIDLYSSLMGLKVTSCGSIQHPEIPTFRDSPDGLLLDVDGVLEVKCPLHDTHGTYLMDMWTPEDLLVVKPEYYWQCIAHLAVTGASFCDWMSYCESGVPSVCMVTIERDEDAIDQLLERIQKAEALCQGYVSKARDRKIRKHQTAVACHNNQ